MESIKITDHASAIVGRICVSDGCLLMDQKNASHPTRLTLNVHSPRLDCELLTWPTEQFCQLRLSISCNHSTDISKPLSGHTLHEAESLRQFVL